MHKSWKFFKSAFKQFVKFKIDGSEEDNVASSANRSRMHIFIDIRKSLMYIRKSKGPRTDPWGTPAAICFVSDNLY